MDVIPMTVCPPKPEDTLPNDDMVFPGFGEVLLFKNGKVHDWIMVNCPNPRNRVRKWRKKVSLSSFRNTWVIEIREPLQTRAYLYIGRGRDNSRAWRLIRTDRGFA